MNIKEYAEKAVHTMKMDPTDYSKLKDRTVHSVFGLVTEVGELCDIVKRTLYYGTPFNKSHFKEEMGDLMWYWINACVSEGLDPEEIMQENIDKLKQRYPEKFSEENAIKRMDKL
jgi:NTP pyrophosphatase (non-canonical NTP hydrolase)